MEKQTRVFQVQSTPDTLVRFDPTGRRLLANASDGTSAVWDPGTGRQVARFPGYTLALGLEYRSRWQSDFSPDGKRVLIRSRGSDGFEPRSEVKVVDVATGEVVFSPTTFGKCTHVAYRPDGLQVAAFCTKAGEADSGNLFPNEVLFWDLKSDRPIVCQTPGFNPLTVCYSPDSTKLMAVGQTTLPRPTGQTMVPVQHELRVWDTSTGAEQVFPFQGENNFAIWAVAFSPDGRHLFVQGEQNRIQVYDLAREQGDRLLPWNLFPSGPTTLALSPDGSHLAAATAGVAGVRVCDVGDTNRVRVLDKETFTTACTLAFDPTGARLFSATPSVGGGVTVTVWGTADWA